MRLQTAPPFFLKLADLAVNVSKQRKTLVTNLLGIQNVIWTNESHVFQNLTESSILKKCATELCTGKALNSEFTLKPVTSSSSRPVPFYQPLVNSVKSWFSLESWSVWGDRVLDSMANGILNYSQQVVENAPGYYPGRLDSSKSLTEDSSREFYNYPVPHFRAIDQGEPLDVQRFNHMQALPQTQGFNHTSLPPMLNSGFQPLMLSK